MEIDSFPPAGTAPDNPATTASENVLTLQQARANITEAYEYDVGYRAISFDSFKRYWASGTEHERQMHVNTTAVLRSAINSMIGHLRYSPGPNRLKNWPEALRELLGDCCPCSGCTAMLGQLDYLMRKVDSASNAFGAVNPNPEH